MDNATPDSRTGTAAAPIQDTGRNPKGAGRPRNLTDPESSHKSEIIAWTGVNRRIRGLIEKQLSFFEKQLAAADKGGSTLSVESMLDVMKGLGDLLTVGTKTVEQGLKALDRGKPHDDEDAESILGDLQGGRG